MADSSSPSPYLSLRTPKGTGVQAARRTGRHTAAVRQRRFFHHGGFFFTFRARRTVAGRTDRQGGARGFGRFFFFSNDLLGSRRSRPAAARPLPSQAGVRLAGLSLACGA